MSSLCGAHSVPRRLNPHWGPCLDVGGMIPSLLCVPQHSRAHVVRTCCNLSILTTSSPLALMSPKLFWTRWTHKQWFRPWWRKGPYENYEVRKKGWCVFFFLLKGRWSELEAFFSPREIKNRVKQKHWIFVDVMKHYLDQQSFPPSQKVNKHVNLAQNIIEVQYNILQFPHLVAITIIICFVACWIKWQGPFCYACHWLCDN